MKRTRVKFCGLTRPCDMEAANALMPEYVGFVFAPTSRRFVDWETARRLRALLRPGILAVGVFVREEPEKVAMLLESGVIDMAQLHGGEDEAYIRCLRKLTDKPLISAFGIETKEDVLRADKSSADFVLMDSGRGGTGKPFDWKLLGRTDRPFFLAGGLDCGNVGEAVKALSPFAVDVSSGIETDGRKDPEKMRRFMDIIRNGNIDGG